MERKALTHEDILALGEVYQTMKNTIKIKNHQGALHLATDKAQAFGSAIRLDGMGVQHENQITKKLSEAEARLNSKIKSSFDNFITDCRTVLADSANLDYKFEAEGK